MNIFFKITFFLVLATSLFSCQKDETTPPEVVIPYAFQYPIDLANIEKFMNEYKMIVDANPGETEFDVTYQKIVNPATEPSIMNQTDYPVEHIIVNRSGINYKLYYINFREGIGNKPTAVDSIFVSYKGDFIANTTEIVPPATTATTFIKPFLFENTPNPTWFELETNIEGWKEIITLFKEGTFADGTGGNIIYSNFGAGIMFLPSAFGYYNRALGNIPKYAPLIFSFKLKKIKYKDHDRDRILSKDEDINPDINGIPVGDGFFTNDDADGDGIQNLFDTDDDGDGIPTKVEVRKPIPFIPNNGKGISPYYPFNNTVDNPLTPTIDESLIEPKGIPDASVNGTTPTRVRRHLDKNAVPPYTTY